MWWCNITIDYAANLDPIYRVFIDITGVPARSFYYRQAGSIIPLGDMV